VGPAAPPLTPPPWRPAPINPAEGHIFALVFFLTRIYWAPLGEGYPRPPSGGYRPDPPPRGGRGGLKKAALFLQGNSDKDRFNTVVNDINKVFDLLRWSGDFSVDHILSPIF